MADVALEMATREAIWSACLGTTARALGTVLPEQVKFPMSCRNEKVVSCVFMKASISELNSTIKMDFMESN